MNRRVLLVAALAVAAVLVFSSSPLKRLAGMAPAPPVLGDAPTFSLTSDDGAVFASSALDGRAWLASFLFTSCPGPCPKLVERLKTIRTRIPASRLAFVSFSVDPGTDTPEVLAAYKRKQGIAGGDGWTFVTGDADKVLALVEHGFLTGVERTETAPAAGGITHGTRVALVDGTGHIRGFYSTDRDEEIDRLERDLASLD